MSFKILVVHKNITNKSLYPGHEFTDAKKFLLNNPSYNIILAGDIHYPFKISTSKGRHIVNTGVMLRMTRDERDMYREPHFWIVDTETDEWKKFVYPYEPAEKVFSEKEDAVKQDTTELMRFIEKLKQKEGVGLNYLRVLERWYEEHKTSEEVRELIIKALEATKCHEM